MLRRPLSAALVAMLAIVAVGCSEEIPIAGGNGGGGGGFGGGGFGGGGEFGGGGFGGRWVSDEEALAQSRHSEAGQELDGIGVNLEFDREQSDYPIIGVSHTYEDPSEEDVETFQTAIQKIDTLAKLDVQSTDEFGDGLVEAVKEMSSLKELGLAGTSITETALDTLAGMTQLEELDIDGTNLPPTTLAKLKPLVNLKQLGYYAKFGIDDREITDAHVEPLSALVNLEELRISFSDVGNDGLAHLAGLTKLKKLNLDGAEIDDDGLAHLSGMTDLEELQISNCSITDAGLEHLAPLTKVTSLDLDDTGVTGSGFVHLKGWRNLLMLSMINTPATGEGIDAFPALQNLSFGSEYYGSDGAVDDDALAKMAGASELVSLNLSRQPVTDAGVAHLAGLTKLEMLVLYRTDVTGTGFAGFPASSQISSLNLALCPVNDEGAAAIGKLGNLYSLNLTSSTITDAGVAKLTGLSKLRSFQLGGTNVGDVAAASLGKMTELSSLDLKNTAVTDAGLSKLSGLKEAWDINVRGAMVTSAGAKAVEDRMGKEGAFDSEDLPATAPSKRFQAVDGDLDAGTFVGDKWLAAAGEKHVLYLWDVESGALVQSIPFEPEETYDVKEVVASKDGKWVAVAAKYVYLVSTESFEATKIGEIEFGGGAAFTPDGKRFAYGRRQVFGETDPGVVLWDLAESKEATVLVEGDSALSSIGIDPEGKRLIASTLGDDNHVWNLETSEVEATFESEFTVGNSLFLGDGELAIASDQGNFAVVDTKTWEVKRTTDFERSFGDPFVFSPDGKTAAREFGYNGFQLVDLASGEIVESSKEKIPLAFTSDSKWLAAARDIDGDRSLVHLGPARPDAPAE